jgi:hypothetical protein
LFITAQHVFELHKALSLQYRWARKIFCVTQVELDENGNETRRLAPEKMCSSGTWPLGAGMTHEVHLVHRLRDCSGIAVDL